MRKFWQTLAAIMLVTAASAPPAHAWGSPVAYFNYPANDGTGRYKGGQAYFTAQSGPYTWIRVKVICSGSGAWHYGPWETGYNASNFMCWPGTFAQVVVGEFQ